MKTKKIKKLKQPLVGQLILELRQLLEQTQEEMATSLGVSFSTISRWERGITKPSPVASLLIETKLKDLGNKGDKLLDRYCAQSSS